MRGPQAATPFAHDLVDAYGQTHATCQEKCREPPDIAQPEEVRAAVVHGLRSGDDTDLTLAHGIIELAAGDEEEGTLEGLGHLLRHSSRGETDIGRVLSVIEGAARTGVKQRRLHS